MKLIVLTGTAVAAKARLTTELAAALLADGYSLTVLDNNDRPLRLDTLATIRLPPGCACCSVAGPLLRAMRSVTTDMVLLPVSAQANPETLDLLLRRLPGTDWTVVTLAIVDEPTRQRLPYLAASLSHYADAVLDPTVDIAEALQAVYVASTR